MFLHSCTSCDKKQLIFPSQVTGVTATDSGLQMTFTCWCGAEQVQRSETRTGTRAERRTTDSVAA